MRCVHMLIVIMLYCMVFTGTNYANGEEQNSAETVKLAKPTPAQAAWQDMELGMFIHFGIETWQDKETDDEPVMANLELFNPTNVNTDQWVRVAESFGAKYIILVAKHHGGFCLWQTETTEYSIKNTSYKDGKGDIVAELAESCRKRGMKLGLYISPADFSQKTEGGGKSDDAQIQKKYNNIYRQQWIELLTRYGEIMEIWFDGSTVVKMGDIIQQYASDAMIFQSSWATIRWVGNEEGYAPYPSWNSVKRSDAVSGVSTSIHGDPEGDTWLPIEVDTVIRYHYWFWSTTNEKDLRSLDELMDVYYRSVGHGAVLLLNIAPDSTGRIPDADAKLAAEFGAEIKRRFGQSIVETEGQGEVVELSFDKPKTINHVIIMEDILQGERVREYVIQGLVNGKWQRIAKGSAIGHKKIDRFDPIRVSKVRLRILKSATRPIIRKLAVYNTT